MIFQKHLFPNALCNYRTLLHVLVRKLLRPPFPCEHQTSRQPRASLFTGAHCWGRGISMIFQYYTRSACNGSRYTGESGQLSEPSSLSLRARGTLVVPVDCVRRGCMCVLFACSLAARVLIKLIPLARNHRRRRNTRQIT